MAAAAEPKWTTDKRVDPYFIPLLQGLSKLVASEAGGPPPPTDPKELIKGIEAMSKSFAAAQFGKCPETGFEATDHQVPGEDGNSILVRIYKPTNNLERKTHPAIVYLHGGGMAINSVELYHTFYAKLCTLGGVAVVAPNFRNSTEAPFPAGLHDCYAATMWAYDQAATLGLDVSAGLSIGGESGGANLTVAVCLLAKERDRLSVISRHYLGCPWITPNFDSASHKELEGFYGGSSNSGMAQAMSAMVKLYEGEDKSAATNKLAWPLLASVEDLKGLPPALVVTHELDVFREEGEEHYRKLRQAGVPAVCYRMVGTLHGASLLFALASPMAVATARLLGDFVKFGFDE